MSANEETIQPRVEIKDAAFPLWLRQVGAILRLELKKNFFSRRSVLVYLLALMPIGLLTLVEIINPPGRTSQQFLSIYSIFYNAMILRTVVFFGFAWIFMHLFRGEIVDRSLHYYFLSAVRREVLVAGKYISGLLTSIILFVTMTALCIFLIYLPLGYSGAMNQLFNGPGLNQVLTYLGTTVLACI